MLSSKHFIELVEHSSDGISLSTNNGKILYVNPALCRLVQRSVEEILHAGRDILFRAGDEKLAAALKQRDEIGSAREELEIVDKNNNLIPVEISSVFYAEENGVKYYSSIFRDIRERKALEKEILESKERFQVLSDSAFEGIAISIDGILLEVNKAMANMFHCRVDDLINIPAINLVTEECRDVVQEHIKNNYTDPYRLTGLRKDGSTFPLEVCGKQSFYKGMPARITSFRDITDSVYAQKEIKNYEIQFRNLFAHGSDMIALLNEKAEYLFVAPSVQRILGYSPAELKGISALSLVHPEDLPAISEKFVSALKNKMVMIPHFRCRHANGSYVWIETVLDNMLEDKNVRAILASSRDITQRKLAELALRQREKDLHFALENMRTIFDYSMDMICAIDDKDTFIEVSAASEDILGYKPFELIGRKAADFVFEADKLETKDFAKKVKHGKPTVNYENRFVHKSGEIIDLMWSANWLSENKIMLCIARDVTDKKRVIQENKLNEQKFRSLFEQNPDAVFSFDCDGKIVSTNKVFKDIFPEGPGEGQDLFYFLNQKNDIEIKKILEEGINGNADTFVTGFTNKNGHILMARITLIPIVADCNVTGGYCVVEDITESWQNEQRLLATRQMLEDAASGIDLKELLNNFLQNIEDIYATMHCAIVLRKKNKLIHFVSPTLSNQFISLIDGLDVSGIEENSLITPTLNLNVYEDGETQLLRNIAIKTHIEAYISYPLTSATGDVIGYLSFNYTIKEKFHEKHVEIISQLTRLISLVIDNRHSLDSIKRKNKELKKINREIDRFAYSTSHELRAPLTSIVGLVGLAEKYKNGTEDANACLKMIEKSAVRLQKFIKKIGDYHHDKSAIVSKEPINLNWFLNELITGLKQSIEEENIVFEVNIPKDLIITSDANRLRIVFQNVLQNAAKFADTSKPENRIKIYAADGVNYTEIMVEDNGIGIDEDCLPKVCDMFFRATEVSNGSGLGLYIVKEILNRLRGKIEISSQLHIGTTVKILLPVAIEK